MAGAVIQATGRLTFEDGLRPFVEMPIPNKGVQLKESYDLVSAESNADT